METVETGWEELRKTLSSLIVSGYEKQPEGFKKVVQEIVKHYRSGRYIGEFEIVDGRRRKTLGASYTVVDGVSAETLAEIAKIAVDYYLQEMFDECRLEQRKAWFAAEVGSNWFEIRATVSMTCRDRGRRRPIEITALITK